VNSCGGKMNRRTAIRRLATFFLTTASLAEAEQVKKVWRIGSLRTGSPSDGFPQLEAFREGLRQLGYVEGQNIIIEYRYAEGRNERIPDLAVELVRLKVAVIVAGGTEAIRAAKKATGTIPIVMAISSDPLGSGLVESLARPGGNVTGLSGMSPELSGKRVELFRETFPKVRRLAVLWYTGSNAAFRETRAAAQAFGFKMLSLEVRVPEDLDNAFARVTKERSDGLIPISSAFMAANRKRIVEFAAKNRLPAIYPNELFTEDGGLMSYAASVQDSYRRAATYVDKILKGRTPADLPVEQPMKFELIISLIAAKQIGVTIPPNVLVRADKVIR
jgi:putative ABC transport system substrate-binding protein